MLNKTPDTRREWKALTRHRKATANVSVTDLCAQDEQRFTKFHAMLDDLLFDYSKQDVDAETLSLLMKLAHSSDVEGWRAQMFAGAAINSSEQRAVLHTALRDPNASPEIRAALDQVKKFSDTVRRGPITDVVNIGIGGSDLGPHMACAALQSFADGPRVHFVSNVDGAHMAHTLKNLKPETTLFVIASKTFTTQETMANAQTAKAWAGGCQNFAAVTANAAAARNFGIAEDYIFPLWDWVGGRYSVWSAIGLSIALSTGYENFSKFLNGAHAADTHFQQAPLEKNIPALMAMIGIWQRNFNNRGALAILPYAQDLALMPAWLQQLDMESNGKNHDRNGQRVMYSTSPVVFGGAGTNGQHAFYQMLHQGTDIVPCDFVIAIDIPNSDAGAQEKLLANALGQSQALMQGQKSTQAWNIFDGNRPSSTIAIPALNPYYLGMLMALYEHKIFVQGIVWNLNSFDQWGVELGKVLSKNILGALQSGDTTSGDSSTRGLLGYILSQRPR